jgi:hypothetical protein
VLSPPPRPNKRLRGRAPGGSNNCKNKALSPERRGHIGPLLHVANGTLPPCSPLLRLANTQPSDRSVPTLDPCAMPSQTPRCIIATTPPRRQTATRPQPCDPRACPLAEHRPLVILLAQPPPPCQSSRGKRHASLDRVMSDRPLSRLAHLNGTTLRSTSPTCARRRRTFTHCPARAIGLGCLNWLCDVRSALGTSAIPALDGPVSVQSAHPRLILLTWHCD